MSGPWPKLSEPLMFPRTPENCKSCGKECDLARWIECDDQDNETQTVVVLCDDCEKIIDPHPRLYRRLHHHEPNPGSMPCCVRCPLRDGLTCTNPKLKSNGGSGLQIRFPKPTVAFVDGERNGRRCGELVTQYHGRCSCDGHLEIAS